MENATHSCDHAVVQHDGSEPQTSAVQELQLTSSGPPIVHSLWVHWPQLPQSAGQLWHDSEALQEPSPQDPAHDSPHTVETWPTHWLSHELSQQNGSA